MEKNKIPKNIEKLFNKNIINNLYPCQKKAIKKDIFSSNKNFLVCSPTGSGKTLISEFLLLDIILNKKQKVIYITPLKALNTQLFKDFNEKFGKHIKIHCVVSEFQNKENLIENHDLLILTSEKLDSIIRKQENFLNNIGLIIIDEIHLLSDLSRGPTLEILITLFLLKFQQIKLLGLSSTIGNPKEIAKWLDNAILILDDFRPVKLNKHIYFNGKLKKYK